MSLMSELVGQRGVYSLLNSMYEAQDVLNSTDLKVLVEGSKISDDLFSELHDAGLFIATPRGFYISSRGKKVTILLKRVNGYTNDAELLLHLSYLNPDLRPYELITEDVTNYFIDIIERVPNFIRLSICSPWIRLDEPYLERFQAAVIKARKTYKNLQIHVISKPKQGYRNWKASVQTFNVLRKLGAEIVTNSKLHTKLYISEPGPYGGAHYAILGSENLTGRKNIELAIRIENDNEILRRLNQYFDVIRQESDILKEVE